MVSGTDFLIAEWDDIAPRLAAHPRAPWDAGELEQVAAQCRSERALCLLGPDGIVVVELLPQGARLELWIRLAAGFRAGAFARAEAGLCGPIARDLGASTVAFRPARRGWERLLGPQWSKRGVDYARPVDADPGTAQIAA